LFDHSLFITGEAFWPVQHALLGLPSSQIDQIEHIYSHPQALLQCEVFLETLPAQRHAFYDTAGAAKWVAKQNTTRFIVIAQDQPPPRAEGACKTSVVLELPHEPGALYRALEPFAQRGINLTKLESRPLRIENWCYRFYLDFEGYQEELQIQKALEELKERVASWRVLGSYPQGTM
jgi:chorismate mutase/prephenate dehydratase